MKLPPSLRGGFQDKTTESSLMFSTTGNLGGSGRSVIFYLQWIRKIISIANENNHLMILTSRQIGYYGSPTSSTIFFHKHPTKMLISHIFRLHKGHNGIRHYMHNKPKKGTIDECSCGTGKK